MKINKKFALSLALTGALALAACGPQEDKGTNNGGNQTEGNNNKTEQVEQGEKLEGSVAIDGSSTVFPIMEAVSEEYDQYNQKFKHQWVYLVLVVDLKAFIAGETDISNASRPIKDEEAANLKKQELNLLNLKLHTMVFQL